MNLQELEARYLKFESLVKNGFHQIQHAHNLFETKSKREVAEQFDALRREFSTVTSKLTSFEDMQKLQTKLDKLELSLKGVEFERQALTPALFSGLESSLEALKEQVASLQGGNYVPAVGNKKNNGAPIQCSSSINDETADLMLEKVAFIQKELSIMKEEENRRLDEVRTAIFLTIEGLRKQIPLARDYSPSIEQLRTRVKAMEDALNGSEPKKTGADVLLSRLEGLESAQAAASSVPTNSGIVDGLAIRLLNLERLIGVRDADINSQDRRIKALEEELDLSKLALRIEALEQLYSGNPSKEALPASPKPDEIPTENKNADNHLNSPNESGAAPTNGTEKVDELPGKNGNGSLSHLKPSANFRENPHSSINQ